MQRDNFRARDEELALIAAAELLAEEDGMTAQRHKMSKENRCKGKPLRHSATKSGRPCSSSGNHAAPPLLVFLNIEAEFARPPE